MSTIARPFERGRAFTAIRGLSAYHVAAVAIFGAIFVAAIVPRFDADLWWHLLVGREILTHHSVPTQDFLSYTVPGHAWIDHEWLSEVWMYGAFALGGLKLVVGVFAVLTVAAYILLFGIMRLRGVNHVLALAMTLLAVVSAYPSWGTRVQIVTLLFAAFFGFVLERYRATGGREWLATLVAGTWLWSNLHGGFVVGLLLIAAYAVGGTLDRVQGGMSWPQALKVQRPLGVSFALGIVVTLLNPNTYHQLLYPLNFLSPNAFTNTIQESLSPNFHLFQVLPFELMLVGLVVCGLLARRRVSWIDILLVVGFTHLALQETRNILLWGVVAVPVLAIYFQDVLRSVADQFERLNRPVDSARVRVVNWGLLVAIVALTVALFGRSVTPQTVNAAQTSSFPAGAVSYLQHHRLWGHGFNSYSYGGYLMWKITPRYPVFIDSRADTVYTDQVLSDYLSIYGARPSWQSLVRYHHIRWVFVERDAPIAQVLTQTDGWQVLFKGRQADIFVYKG